MAEACFKRNPAENPLLVTSLTEVTWDFSQPLLGVELNHNQINWDQEHFYLLEMLLTEDFLMGMRRLMGCCGIGLLGCERKFDHIQEN